MKPQFGGAVRHSTRLLVVALALSVCANLAQWTFESSAIGECHERLEVALRAVKRKAGEPAIDVNPHEAEGGAGAGRDCPEPPACPVCANDADPNAGTTTTTDDNSAGAVVVAGDSGEEGWVFGLERKASRTDNTVYDPAEDIALSKRGTHRYGRSFVPKGAWKVRVSGNKWVTMDEVAFAYDVWYEETQAFQYTSWLGVSVQQDPIDAFAIQDMLWRVKPDLIVEIGTNTGGGAIFYSTIMKAYNPNGKIVTLDVKPVSNWMKKNVGRCVGCTNGDAHPWWNDGMINFIKGRVTEEATRQQVQVFVDKATKVLVIEDASHRYPDTLENIEATFQWVSVDSYLLVQDTKMDRFVHGLGKKYGKLKFGPMRSVDEFVHKHPNFVIDRRFEYLLYSQHHRGFLRRKS